MATTVASRECECGMLYKTKVKKGRDTRLCPDCKKDNSDPQ